MNYYDELEVSTSASTEVIKAAYKAQAKKYHPDIYRGDPRFASEKLVNLNGAYDVLTNPQKREEYDYLNSISVKSNTKYSVKTENNSYTNTNSKNSNEKNYNVKYSKSKNSNDILMKIVLIAFCILCITLLSLTILIQ